MEFEMRRRNFSGEKKKQPKAECRTIFMVNEMSSMLFFCFFFRLLRRRRKKLFNFFHLILYDNFCFSQKWIIWWLHRPKGEVQVEEEIRNGKICMHRRWWWGGWGESWDWHRLLWTLWIFKFSRGESDQFVVRASSSSPALPLADFSASCPRPPDANRYRRGAQRVFFVSRDYYELITATLPFTVGAGCLIFSG